MARVTFASDYRASLQTSRDGRIVVVAAKAGETIELDDDQVAFVRRDCPGAILDAAPKAAPADAVEPDVRAPESPTFDRQVKRGPRRGL